jgi:hypothetical protein
MLVGPDFDAWRADGCPPVVPAPTERWPGEHVRWVRPVPVEEPTRPTLKARVIKAMPDPVVRAYVAARNGGTQQVVVVPPPPTRVGALGEPIPEPTNATPEEIGIPSYAIEWQVPIRYRDAWGSSRYFALPTYYDGRVRLNLRGRERDGVVDPDEYHALCDEIEAGVRATRNARTGEPVVREVNRLRVDDPFAPDGADADLEFVFAEVTDAWIHPEVGPIGPVPFRRTGAHSPRGFAMIAGPGIEPADLGTHAAIDVPAQVLALLHGAVPDGLEVDGSPFLPT